MLTLTFLVIAYWNTVAEVISETCDGSIKTIGTGVAIRTHVILTNYHVIRDSCVNVKIRVLKGIFPATIVLSIPEMDIAFLKSEATLTPVKISTSLPKKGETIFAVGFPGGYPTIFYGKVLGIKYINGKRYIETDITLSEGSSGGPLFNSHKELIGLNKAVLRIVGSYINVSSISIPIIDVIGYIERF